MSRALFVSSIIIFICQLNLFSCNIWDNLITNLRSPQFILPLNFQLALYKEKDFKEKVIEVFFSSKFNQVKIWSNIQISPTLPKNLTSYLNFTNGSLKWEDVDEEDSCNVRRNEDIGGKVKAELLLKSYDLLTYFDQKDSINYRYFLTNPIGTERDSLALLTDLADINGFNGLNGLSGFLGNKTLEEGLAALATLGIDNDIIKGLSSFGGKIDANTDPTTIATTLINQLLNLHLSEIFANKTIGNILKTKDLTNATPNITDILDKNIKNLNSSLSNLSGINNSINGFNQTSKNFNQFKALLNDDTPFSPEEDAIVTFYVNKIHGNLTNMDIKYNDIVLKNLYVKWNRRNNFDEKEFKTINECDY